MSDELIDLYRDKIKAKVKYESFVKEIAIKWSGLKPSIKINIDFRLNDHKQWETMDFILGIEIKRSHNHKPCDLCDAMCGRYPKDFMFIGFHPDCICYETSVQMNHEYSAIYSLAKYSKKYGERYKSFIPNYIDDIPETVIPFIQKNIRQTKDQCFLDLNNMFYLYIKMKEAENEYNLKKNS